MDIYGASAHKQTGAFGVGLATKTIWFFLYDQVASYWESY